MYFAIAVIIFFVLYSVSYIIIDYLLLIEYLDYTRNRKLMTVMERLLGAALVILILLYYVDDYQQNQESEKLEMKPERLIIEQKQHTNQSKQPNLTESKNAAERRKPALEKAEWFKRIKTRYPPLKLKKELKDTSKH
jgi:hypothetical protein